jgi:hypothetical protein
MCCASSQYDVIELRITRSHIKLFFTSYDIVMTSAMRESICSITIPNPCSSSPAITVTFFDHPPWPQTGCPTAHGGPCARATVHPLHATNLIASSIQSSSLRHVLHPRMFLFTRVGYPCCLLQTILLVLLWIYCDMSLQSVLRKYVEISYSGSKLLQINHTILLN